MNVRCAGDGYYGTAAGAGGPVSLYVHFPFCVRKCRYCDFLSGPSDEDARHRYLDALEREIRAKAAWLPGIRGAAGIPEADTVFFGGGTPSLMTPRQLDHLMYVLSCSFRIDEDAEITMECNPGTADYGKLRAFCGSGINRLSVGVQSFHEDELHMLGRVHTAQQARQCVADARRAGCANVSLDLMSALPGQSYERWMDNLSEAVLLDPDHISAYSLILEEGTPLKEAYDEARRPSENRPGAPGGRSAAAAEDALPPLPDEDEDRRMYHDTKIFLKEHGYRRYEISNYARPGYESRHNSGYWTGHPYLGLGLGASSYLIRGGTGRIRWSNPSDMDTYLRECDRPQTILSAADNLSAEDQMEEFMFLGLRRMRGVSERDFAAEFGRTMDEVYGEVLKRYCGLGLLRRADGYIALTDTGIDVSNTIMADFLL